MKSNARSTLTVVGLSFYLLISLVVFQLSKSRTQGSFTAPQDDPYIHLALAEQIAHGHYGINATEPSSPSSSMLWPFLLAPFAATSFGIYEALAWNGLAGCCAVVLIAGIVEEWPSTVLSSMTRRVIAVLAFVLLANLVGLTLLGMEHTLQVMLAIACAAGVCRAINGRPIPWWSVAAAAAAPWIRYEDFTLTIALGIILLFQRRRQALLLIITAAVFPLLAFSLFLRHIGLESLPVSVLVKSGTAATQSGIASKAISIVSAGVIADIKNPVHWTLLILFLGLSVMIRYEPAGIRRIAAMAAAIGAGLHLIVGRFGWWYRYEVYIVIFCTVVLLRLVLERVHTEFVWYALGAAALSSVYVRGLWDTPAAAEAIRGQQYQMHRFVTEYYHGNFAVNDLGEVGYRHGDAYILDLFGLASIEAARQPQKDAAWTQAMVQSHDVGLVMVYPNLFGIPSSWQALGQMCLLHKVNGIAGRCVFFYSTQPSGTEALRREFAEFAKTVPPQTTARLALP